MNSVREIPWLRILAEGLVVVISILLAFWIQAWWEGHQEQGYERVVLQSLLDDLERKKALVDNDRIYTASIFESATTLLQVAQDPDQGLSEDAIDRLIGGIVWYHQDSEWESAPLNSLIMGGDIALISNAVLLQKLAALQNSISVIRNNYRADKEFHYNVLAPFLMTHANLPQIYAGIEHTPGNPESTFEFPEIGVSRVRDHTGLLSRSDFQGLVVIKIDLLLDIQRALRVSKLDDEIDQIIVLIKHELGD